MAFEEFSRNYKVQAEQIEEDNTSVITQKGSLTAQRGQWEVRHPDGTVEVMDDDAFQEAYGENASDDSDNDDAVIDDDSDDDSADDSDDEVSSGFVTPGN